MDHQSDRAAPDTDRTQYGLASPSSRAVPPSPPAAPFVIGVVEQLLSDRNDAQYILSAVANRLGVALTANNPGLAMDQPTDLWRDFVDRMPQLVNLRDAFAHWHAEAASRRRLSDLSRQVRRLTPSPARKVTIRASPAVSLTASSPSVTPEDSISNVSAPAVGLPFITAEDITVSVTQQVHEGQPADNLRTVLRKAANLLNELLDDDQSSASSGDLVDEPATSAVAANIPDPPQGISPAAVPALVSRACWE